MSASPLLDRLEGVKQTGPGRWLAGCPAHKDRSPSLSVRELDDGRVLLHDFAGCATDDVLTAVGLDMTALCLPGSGPAGGHAPTHSRIPAADVLKALDHENNVAVLLITDVLDRRTISEADWQRLAVAARRIGAARDLERRA